MRRPTLLFAAVTLAVTLSGCGQAPPEEAAPPPPAVTVSVPLDRTVTDHAEFTARTAAVEFVQVRARVWGHLEKIKFTEGAEVKEGDVLFVIDQRPYKAALARADAEVSQAEARSNRLMSDYGRARNLVGTRTMSREEFDKTSGDLSEAQAAVRSAQAARETAKLNLDYTEVRSPINGQVGRVLVTRGNLVASGEGGGTVLCAIVSVDPVYVYFDVDDLTFDRVRRYVRGGAEVPKVEFGLSTEKGFPHTGSIDYVDPQIDPNTGTLKVRGVFKNTDRLLTPGLFGRVRVPLGAPHKALLVTDRAVDTDQGKKVVYVVNSSNVVERREVDLGRLHDGLREVVSGVKAGERVVIDGIQRVRDGVPVEPKVVEMPNGSGNHNGKH